MRVIWAYHHKDMGEAGQNYHGSNRGTKSLRLLNPEKEEVLSASLPYFDLTNKDVSHVGLCGDGDKVAAKALGLCDWVM